MRQMNERIRELAEQAGWDMEWGGATIEQVVAFAEVVAKTEREACARVCEAFGQTLEVDVGPNFAEAIRARGVE